MNDFILDEKEPAARTPQLPQYRLDDPRFVWIPSGQTDVQRTWRKYGWTPPSETRTPPSKE